MFLSYHDTITKNFDQELINVILRIVKQNSLKYIEKFRQRLTLKTKHQQNT